MTKKKPSRVELAYVRLLREFNKKNHVWKRTRDGKNVSTPGRWTLDGAYGGFKVAEISNKVGGERDLFDQKRRSPANFVRWVDIVISARRQGKRR